VVRAFGGSRIGLWTIKHLVAPIDRATYRMTGRPWLGRLVAPVLVLTIPGRRTGQAHSTPLVYVRDGDRLIVCNVNPGFERVNPWVLNLQAHPQAEVGVGGRRIPVVGREATSAEVDAYWPRLTAAWPAYLDFYSRGGERRIFVLEPRASRSA
jgi:deazaflavin-dependent oxidoreductase (nitroreductase family)